MSPSRSISRALAPLGLLAVLAACTDGPSPLDPPAPESGDAIEIQALSCTADVRTGTVSCDGETDEAADGLPSIILNPSGRWVRLTTSNSSYANEVLTFDATVQNLVPQTLGVSESGEYDGAGVRVFFSELPVVTSGTGQVTVNGTETGKFTRVGQQFYRYPQTLERDEVSAPRQWSFNVPATVNTFRYTVLVAASVQYPQGWVEIVHGSVVRVAKGGTLLLKAVVRSALGQDVTASAPPITWSIADASVATVAGSTLTAAAISGLSTLTAASGNLSAAARLEVGAPFTQFGAGYGHTCGLASTGRVYCWGGNGVGQVGDNTRIQRLTPTRVATAVAFAQIGAGYHHTCGLAAAGQAWCWGFNRDGELGDGTTTERDDPVAVQQGAVVFTAISGGVLSTCALSPAGQSWCWGWNEYGKLGDGTLDNRLTPVAVQQKGLPYEEIVSGYSHTCARATARLAFCWGDNRDGQLGTDTVQSSRTRVAVPQGTERYVQMTGGRWFTCALSSRGQTYCWGFNSWGMLGDDTTTPRSTPAPVHQAGSTYVQITAGLSHACGLTAAGQAWCWGRNDVGQLGDNTPTTRLTPVPVQQGGSSYVEIQTRNYHTCGRTAAGRLFCWGFNATGQLGDGTTATRFAPVAVQGAP